MFLHWYKDDIMILCCYSCVLCDCYIILQTSYSVGHLACFMTSAFALSTELIALAYNTPTCSDAVCSAHPVRHNNGRHNNAAGSFTCDIRFAYLLKVITDFFYYVIHGTTWQVLHRGRKQR